MTSIFGPSHAMEIGPKPIDMTLNPFSLAFSGTCAELETAFLDQYAIGSLAQVRFTLILSLILYVVFGILDYVVAPALTFRFWFVRFVVVSPALIIVIVFSFTERFKSIMQPVIALLILVGGGGIIYMAVVGPQDINRTYFAGLMLVMMIGCTALRVRFVWASTTSLILAVAYLMASMASGHLPKNFLVTNNFFCMAAALAGLLASYNLEFHARRDYFMSHLLRIERQKVEGANQQLEQTVEKRTAMLVLANEKLHLEIEAHQQLDKEKKQLEEQLRQAQKMEAIGTLAGGIAHDFNNILAAIMGHTELALMQLEQKPQAEQCLSEVLRASDRAKDLVAQILSFSRYSGSELKPMKISVVIKEALRLIRSTLPTTIQIDKMIQDQESIIVGNATHIHQILMNLCTNAAHAMEGADGTLTVSLNAVDVNGGHPVAVSHFPTGLSPGKYVCLMVADTGHGIPNHLINRIFDPYFTTKEKDVGTGLGLAVVQGIVQNHGGNIKVESKTGEGTIFYVYLPRVESDVKDDFKTLQAVPIGKENILFVDDDPALAELGGKLLATLGYKVITETKPQSALQKIEKTPQAFDLVITDLIMPGLTGEVLAREILKRTPQMPIIACTGFNEKIGKDRLIQSGIKGVLYKPITIHHLAQVIRNVLDKKPLADSCSNEQSPVRKGSESAMQ